MKTLSQIHGLSDIHLIIQSQYGLVMIIHTKKGGGVDTTEQGYAKLIYYHLMKYMAQYSSGEDWVQPDSVVQQQIEVGYNPTKSAWT